ncbi:MAG: hypothetical protein QXT42_06935, partial [Thermoplasmata archaeon]
KIGRTVEKVAGEAVEELFVKPKFPLTKAAIKDVRQLVTGLAPGLAHTAGLLKEGKIEQLLSEQAAGFEEVATHPFKYPVSFGLLFAGGAGGALKGLSTAGRVSRVVRAAKAAGASPGETIVAAARALPTPRPVVKVRIGGQDMTVPLSRNPIIAAAQRRRWRARERKLNLLPPHIARGRPTIIERAGAWLQRQGIPVERVTMASRTGRLLARVRHVRLAVSTAQIQSGVKVGRFLNVRFHGGLSPRVTLHPVRNTALGLALSLGDDVLKEPSATIGRYVSNIRRNRERAGKIEQIIKAEHESKIELIESEIDEMTDRQLALRERELAALEDDLERLRVDVALMDLQLALAPAAQALIERAGIVGGFRKAPPGFRMSRAQRREATRFLESLQILRMLSAESEQTKILMGALEPDLARERLAAHYGAMLGIAKPKAEGVIYQEGELPLLIDFKYSKYSSDRLPVDEKTGEPITEWRKAFDMPSVDDIPSGVVYFSRHRRYWPDVIGPSRLPGFRESALYTSIPSIKQVIPEVDSMFGGTSVLLGFPHMGSSMLGNYLATMRMSHILNIIGALVSTGIREKDYLAGKLSDPNLKRVHLRNTPEAVDAAKALLVELETHTDDFGRVSPRVKEQMKSLFSGEEPVFYPHLEPGTDQVVYVDQRLFRDLGFSPYGENAFIRLVDIANEAWRWLILFTVPRYFLNAFGNVIMGTMMLGPAFAGWAMQGMLVPRTWTRYLRENPSLLGVAPKTVRSPETAMRYALNKVDAGLGESRTVAVGARFRATKALQRNWNTITDLWFRRAMFLAAAARHGYRDRDVLRLLLDPQAADNATLQSILLDANRMAVDFDNALLSNFERDVVRRVFIFYPWTRSAIEWTLRSLGDVPSLAVASTLLAQQADAYYREAFPGGVPQWARSSGIVKVGEEKVRERVYPVTISFGSILTPLTFAQVIDVAEEALSLLRGQPATGDVARALQPSLSTFLGPVFGAPESGRIESVIPSIPQYSAFRSSPTFPRAEPLRLLGGTIVPRLTSAIALRRQFERELPEGQRETRLWHREAFKVMRGLREQGYALSASGRAALVELFHLRGRYSSILAREGGRDDIPTLRR